MFCVKCGSPVPEGAAFCPECGARIYPGSGAAWQQSMRNRAKSSPRNYSLTSLSQWFTIKGRIARQEFWLRALVVLCGSFIAGIAISIAFVLAMICFAGSADGSKVLFFLGILCGIGVLASLVFIIALWICWITTCVRRLHDLNLSGWWYIAIWIGGAALDAVFFGLASVGAWIAIGCIEGTRGPNLFGDDPRG